MKTPTPQALAIAFCQVLNEWLSTKDIALAVARNAAETDKSICHSHDFCDANAALIEAWETIAGEPFNFDSMDPDLVPLIEAAHSIARDAEFNPEGVETEEIDPVGESFRMEGVK